MAGVGPAGEDEQQIGQPVQVRRGERIRPVGIGLEQCPGAAFGPARDLLHDPRIRDAYLGGQAA